MHAEDRIRDLADKDAIRELLHLYCVGSDRMDTALVESVFYGDARLHYGYFDGGPKDLSAFSSRFLARFAGTPHSLTNVIVRLDGQPQRSLSYITALPSGAQRSLGRGARIRCGVDRRSHCPSAAVSGVADHPDICRRANAHDYGRYLRAAPSHAN